MEKDIQESIKALVKYHNVRVNEQKEDQKYYDDEFGVDIHEPFHVVRTGTASKIVDSVVDHIETSNPQAFREPNKKTEAAIKSALKVGRLLNSWLNLLVFEIEEAIKNLVQRGDTVFQIEYNDNYDIQKPDTLPLIVTTLDPIYVFTDPYDALRPDRVVKKYGMNVNYVKSMYPDWAPKKKTLGDIVEYEAYWDKDNKYFEIGEVAVNGGLLPNIYEFTPFVHCYAGFGKRSPEGKPESLAVGRLRKIRGRLKEKCEIESRVDSIIGLYANPMRLLSKIDQQADEADRKELEESYIGPGANLVSPFGWKQEIYVPNVHIEQLLAHLSQIDGALGLDLPPVMSGQASGPRSSGRLEDILSENVQKKYSKLVHNLSAALAEVLSMGLKILDTIPEALPVSARFKAIKNGKEVIEEFRVTKEDIDGYYDCRVELNPEEAIEHDRKVMLGRLLVNEGRISWKQFLVKYMGMTEDEADDTMTDAIAETAILTDPMMSQIRTMEALEQAGMARYIEKLTEMNQGRTAAQGQKQVRPSEARNPTATETIRQSLNEKGMVRTPPEGVTR